LGLGLSPSKFDWVSRVITQRSKDGCGLTHAVSLVPTSLLGLIVSSLDLFVVCLSCRFQHSHLQLELRRLKIARGGKNTLESIFNSLSIEVR
jgi:hypothetical protein